MLAVEILVLVTSLVVISSLKEKGSSTSTKSLLFSVILFSSSQFHVLFSFFNLVFSRMNSSNHLVLSLLKNLKYK